MDVVQLRARVGMVFQKPNPFPKSIYENVAYGPRIHGLAAGKAELDAIVETLAEARRAVGRGQGSPDRKRHRAVRRPAAAPVHRPRHRGRSRGDPDGRAVLGARSDRHRAIEELIHELRGRYAIVIVTHNMQQAARVSQRTAFFHLGKLVEYGETSDIFTNPAREADQGLHHRPLRLRSAEHGTTTGHTVKAFDDDLGQLRGLIAEMGGLAEAAIARSDGGAGPARPRCRRRASSTRTSASTRSRPRSSASAVRIIALRAPMADDLREVVAALKIAGVIERIGDYAKNIAKRVPVLDGRAEHRAAARCCRRWRGSPPRWSATCSTPSPRAIAEAAVAVCERDGAVDDFYNSIFRTLVTHMMENPHNDHARRRTCCSSPRISSGSAITPPTSPRWSISPRPAARWPSAEGRATA